MTFVIAALRRAPRQILVPSYVSQSCWPSSDTSPGQTSSLFGAKATLQDANKVNAGGEMPAHMKGEWWVPPSTCRRADEVENHIITSPCRHHDAAPSSTTGAEFWPGAWDELNGCPASFHHVNSCFTSHQLVASKSYALLFDLPHSLGFLVLCWIFNLLWADTASGLAVWESSIFKST